MSSSAFERADQAAQSLRFRHRHRLSRILNLEDFAPAARRLLPAAIYGYVANGSEEELTLRANRAVFRRLRLTTRVLRGIDRRDMSVELFGRTYAAPFAVAPMGGASAVAYDADLAMARAARACGIPFVLSGNSIVPMEEVGRAYPGAWFAAYQDPDPAKVERMVARVAAAGFGVFVLTADVPVGSNRERDHRAGFSQPIRLNAKVVRDGLLHPNWVLSTGVRTLARRGNPHIDNLEPEGGPSLFSRTVSKIASHTGLSWDTVRQIRSLWRGPLVIKGILSPDDARIARECGADGIVVSNHGGRQLDGAVTSLEALPDVTSEAGDMTVIVDSGFRRGTDVLKGLALGAHATLVGRPFLFGAALAGEAGVLHAIGLLAREVDRDMALIGLANLGEAGPEMLRPVRALAIGHAA